MLILNTTEYFYGTGNFNVTGYKFIFSNKPKYKVTRHLVFWLIIYAQIVFTGTHMNGLADFIRYQSYKFPVTFGASVLPVCFLSVYISLYILFPLLRQKKYILFSAGFIVLVALNCLIELYIYVITRPYICSECGAVTLQDKINTMGGIGINIACFLGVVALGIKFTKSWYLQQISNRLLARQKITSELKLLKARIQPDFLFETLQSLYNKIVANKNEAAEMLLKFAELLSYTLYECDEDFIAAERVFQIIKEFVALEKIMLKTKIECTTTISGNISNKYTPSFIVLPLIQHCVIVLHHYPAEAHAVEINLSAANNIFNCDIYINTNASGEIKKFYVDAINTFTNRLENFYSNNYTLDFIEDKATYTITLSLLLSDSFHEKKIENADKTPYAYAHI